MNNKEREEQFALLYGEHKSDYEIAFLLNCSQTLVFKWRKLNGLKPIFSVGGDRKSQHWRDKALRK